MKTREGKGQSKEARPAVANQNATKVFTPSFQKAGSAEVVMDEEERLTLWRQSQMQDAELAAAKEGGLIPDTSAPHLAEHFKVMRAFKPWTERLNWC